MMRFERVRKLAYSSFGIATLLVLLILVNLQKPMIENTFQNNLILSAVFFSVIGVVLLTVVKDAEESICLVYKSNRSE